MSAGERRPFLFEIGTDELPARFLPVERTHVRESCGALLTEAGLAYGSLRVLASPRRLALIVDDLQTRQDDREVELKGPPKKVCFDADGAPTKAAEGFARKNGVDLADAYEIVDEKGGVFLGARKIVAGRDAAAILAEGLPAVMLGVPFPKTMRWGESDLEYARPIQWLVALLGADVVPVNMAGLEAGRVSRGHRTLADGRLVEIADAESYLPALLEAGVMVDQDARRERIVEGIEAVLAADEDSTWLRDEQLLDEVVDLCEYPTAFAGSYDESFFAVPEEVIVTALKAHQRYFAVADAAGGLKPVFLSARDGDETGLDNVRRGNERVLRARLSDALFYWNFDQRQTPDEHTAQLDAVTWLVGYGSMGDKVKRAAALADWLWTGPLGDGSSTPEALTRAAAIAKFDLVTEMIRDGKEFTKLEGVIAARYAAAAGESETVCALLEDYHRPRSAADGLPSTREAAVLSVADRCDTLAGCWLAGFAPTGAKDPYALRRHALALIRILADLDLRVDVPTILARALEGFADRADAETRENAAVGLAAFVATRLEGHLTATGADLATVRAVLPVRSGDPGDAGAWVRALEGFRGEEDFLKLAQGFKRCRNILDDEVPGAEEFGAVGERWRDGGRGPAGEDFSELPEEAEHSLLAAVRSALPGLERAESERDFAGVFKILSGFGPLIDCFFDSVRVNAEDEGLRHLRRCFLREIYGLFARYADFSAVAPVENLSAS